MLKCELYALTSSFSATFFSHLMNIIKRQQHLRKCNLGYQKERERQKEKKTVLDNLHLALVTMQRLLFLKPEIWINVIHLLNYNNSIMSIYWYVNMGPLRKKIFRIQSHFFVKFSLASCHLRQWHRRNWSKETASKNKRDRTSEPHQKKLYHNSSPYKVCEDRTKKTSQFFFG